MGIWWTLWGSQELELGCNGYTVTGLHECGLVRFPLNKFQKYGAGFKPQKRVRKPPMYSGDIGYVYIYIYTFNYVQYIQIYTCIYDIPPTKWYMNVSLWPLDDREMMINQAASVRGTTMSICQDKYEDQLKVKGQYWGLHQQWWGFHQWIKHDKNLYKGRVQPTTWWMLIGSGWMTNITCTTSGVESLHFFLTSA